MKKDEIVNCWLSTSDKDFSPYFPFMKGIEGDS